MKNTHLLDIDKLTGDEYVAGGEDTFSTDFFIEYGESNFETLYNQLEWSKEHGNCLCTIYGPITALSIVLGRVLTEEERLELVKERISQGDFDKSVGGFTSIGVDVARRWYNRKYPSDPIVSQLVNDKNMLQKLTQKSIPLVTSLRATRAFTIDQRDGVLDNFDSWNGGARYGHCRTRKKLKILDNYKNSYVYRNIDDLEKAMNMAFESRNCYMFIKESMLSAKGKTYLKYMRLGYWNGERANDNITRYECSRIALKMNPKLKEKDVWNGKDGNKDATIYEVTLMLNKGNPSVPVYLGTDRNKFVTRGAVIEMLTV